MNAPTDASESTALAVASRQNYDLSPRDFDEAWRMADYLANSDMVPKDFKGKPGNCLVAVQWGAELGLKTMQAIQNIAVINGRPSLWGDVMLALVRQSPLCEYVVESFEGSGDAMKAVCRVKRRGEPEQVREFSVEDAKLANLLGKDGPWKQYRKRMLQMRARGWALRDVFTDLLKGLHMAEEAMDMPPERFMGAAEVVQPAQAESTGLPDFTEEELAKRTSKIAEFYTKGKTADDIVAFYATKFTVPEAMKARIKALRGQPGSQVQDAAPKGEPDITADAVRAKLHEAKDQEQLAAAASLIARIADEAQRAELTALYELRGDQLPPF